MASGIYGSRRKIRLFAGFSPSLMPPTGDAPLIAGPSGESGVSASGRSDALAWTIAPRRGRESCGLGGFWLPCFEWKFGRGRKSRFEFLLSAAPILIRDMALQIEGEIPHAGLVNMLRGLARPMCFVSGSLSCHRHDGPPFQLLHLLGGEWFNNLYIVPLIHFRTTFCVKIILKNCYYMENFYILQLYEYNTKIRNLQPFFLFDVSSATISVC